VVIGFGQSRDRGRENEEGKRGRKGIKFRKDLRKRLVIRVSKGTKLEIGGRGGGKKACGTSSGETRGRRRWGAGEKGEKVSSPDSVCQLLKHHRDNIFTGGEGRDYLMAKKRL